MFVTDDGAHRARWAVMWIYASKRGKKRIFRKDFGDDYASAEELYFKAKEAGKPYATLACVNMGFPPPVSLRSQQVKKKGRIRGTKKVRVVTVTEDPLYELNLQGKVWCPYCRALREFVLNGVAEVDGIRFADVRYICPICKVSHRDHNIRKWNPTAAMHMENAAAPARRSSSSRKPRRRASRA